MKPSRLLCAALALVMLASCANPSQNTYNDIDVGHNAIILFGTVVSARQVDIKGTNTGGGAGVGALAGGVAGSTIGNGNGSIIGLLGGAIIGGVAVAMTEQALKDRQGIEYIITFAQTGQTQSIVQNIAKTDQPIAEGECVMVQMNGHYQRVLAAKDDSQCEPPKSSKHEKHKKHHDDEDGDDDDSQ
jgi:outer membrane lipoprotein SlyB